MFELKKSFELKDIILPKGAKPFTMLWVDPGEFTVGSIDDDFPEDFEEDSSLPIDEFDVIITKGFWMGQFLVTQAHWKSIGDLPILNKNFWQQQDNDKNWWREKVHLPIYGLNWLEAIQFCRLLNIKYQSQIPKGYYFSLPTEIQWEYACKAGTNNDYIQLKEQDYWAMGNYQNIFEAGTRTSNAWGFYDMLGNIREMCFDVSAYYTDNDEEIPAKDEKVIDWMGNMVTEDWLFPNLPSNQGTERVVRGCHSSVYREFRLISHNHIPDLNPLVGFRVCLRPITEWDLNDPLLQKEGINMLE